MQINAGNQTGPAADPLAMPKSIADRRSNGAAVARDSQGGVVNPLKASPGYAPVACGMAAALPYIDEFIAGHNVNALDDLIEVIAR